MPLEIVFNTTEEGGVYDAFHYTNSPEFADYIGTVIVPDRGPTQLKRTDGKGWPPDSDILKAFRTYTDGLADARKRERGIDEELEDLEDMARFALPPSQRW